MDTLKCDLCGLWNEATEKACRRCGVIFPGRADAEQQANAGAAYAKHFPDPIKNPRVFAGTWFANAASIPAGLFVLIVTLNLNGKGWVNGVAFLAIAAAVTIAWVVGYYFGSSILDDRLTISSGRATARGLGVAALSFAAYIVTASFVIAVASSVNDHNPVDNFITTFFGSLLVLSIFGTIFVGWLIALVGLTAGYCLYRYRLAHGVAG